MQTLRSNSLHTVDPRYTTPSFLKVLDDHKVYFRTLPSSQQREVDPAKRFKYKGDFFGLLTELGVAVNYQVAHLLVNDLSSPSDWDGSKQYVTIVPQSEIDSLLSEHTE